MSTIKCRTCGKRLTYEKVGDLPYFPFCSKRCKLLDLGAWLDEERRIPDTGSEEAPPHVSEAGEDSHE